MKKTLVTKTATGATAVAILAVGGLIPTQAEAAQKVRFGSKLDPTVQPSNSVPSHECDPMNPGTECTFVMNEAYGRPDGGELAPVKGRLRKIRVIAGEEGTFKLQLTKAKMVNGTWKARVKAEGPTIHVTGQEDANWDTDTYKVEVFKVNLPIKKGWRLSMKATSTSAVRCSSGGDNTLIFTPPLVLGGLFQDSSSDDGCWPLIEGVIRR